MRWRVYFFTYIIGKRSWLEYLSITIYVIASEASSKKQCAEKRTRITNRFIKKNIWEHSSMPSSSCSAMPNMADLLLGINGFVRYVDSLWVWHLRFWEQRDITRLHSILSSLLVRSQWSRARFPAINLVLYQASVLIVTCNVYSLFLCKLRFVSY